MRASLSLLLLLLIPAASRAEAPVEVKTAGFHLKSRSTYTTAETARAPFWPIGWSKSAPKPQSVEEAPKFTLDPDQFMLTSVIIGRPSLAVINGRAFAAGEFIRASKPKGKGPETEAKAASVIPPGVKVRIARITDGSVILEVGGQTAEIPLRRPQLSNHKAEEEEAADLLKPLSER